MDRIKHVIGIDISTQTITAMLIGVAEEGGKPSELILSSAWMASRTCREERERKTPAVWVELIRECVEELKKTARETGFVEALGISTTFPGAFAVFNDGKIDPAWASLYDNTDDAGVTGPEFEEMLGRAEGDTLNRMWPGNMAVGFAHLVKDGLQLDSVSALVPPNTAFAYQLVRSAAKSIDPAQLFSDCTETTIGGLYNSRNSETLPASVGRLLSEAVPGLDLDRLRGLIPGVQPSWRNVVCEESLDAVRELLGLPHLRSVSIGAGDSPLGALALNVGPDTVINVRGSSDSPMVIVPSPRAKETIRETVLHYPMPTVVNITDSPWCVVAPMLRSGKVWDWVRNLGLGSNEPDADQRLEQMATDALKRRMRAQEGSLARRRLRFDPALGGERAPVWDPRAVGSINGLLECHTLGDIALAALEGMSLKLKGCLSLMEGRYGVEPEKMLLAGGPVRNGLWSWVTQTITGKKTYATTFSDASLLGAAMLGYAAAYDGVRDDIWISGALKQLSDLASEHPLLDGIPVTAPDSELAALEEQYREEVLSEG